VRAARNIAIIALLALVVAAVPGGGNLADGILAALMIAFLVIIGVMGFLVYRQNRLAYMTLDDRRRMILIGAIGAIVLMIAGADELLDTGAGLIVWIAVLGLAVFGIARVVADSRSL
jgi:Kef-type K+ transport system membrane component KefB